MKFPVRELHDLSDAQLNFEFLEKSIPTIVATGTDGYTRVGGPIVVTKNNVNALMQVDANGNTSNIAYYDKDADLVIGPTDPTLSIITQVPINLFKPATFEEFIGGQPQLPWRQTQLNGSTAPAPAAHTVRLSSGATTNGDYVQIDLPNCYDTASPVVGSIARFYFTSQDSLQQDIQFGYTDEANAATSYVRFRLLEGGTAGTWNAETAAGGAGTSTSTGVAHSLRREMWMVDLTQTGVARFWHQDTSTPSNVISLVASISTTLPTAALKPFVRVAANGAVNNRRVDVDAVHTIKNR